MRVDELTAPAEADPPHEKKWDALPSLDWVDSKSTVDLVAQQLAGQTQTRALSRPVRPVKQGDDNYCAAACLKMLLNYKRVKGPSVRDIYFGARRHAGLPDDESEGGGLSVYQVGEYASDVLKLNCHSGTRGSLDDLHKWTMREDRPVMVSVEASDGYHAIVVSSVSSWRVWIRDPAPHKRKLYRQWRSDFQSRWTGNYFWLD